MADANQPPPPAEGATPEDAAAPVEPGTEGEPVAETEEGKAGEAGDVSQEKKEKVVDPSASKKNDFFICIGIVGALFVICLVAAAIIHFAVLSGENGLMDPNNKNPNGGLEKPTPDYAQPSPAPTTGDPSKSTESTAPTVSTAAV